MSEPPRVGADALLPHTLRPGPRAPPLLALGGAGTLIRKRSLSSRRRSQCCHPGSHVRGDGAAPGAQGSVASTPHLLLCDGHSRPLGACENAGAGPWDTCAEFRPRYKHKDPETRRRSGRKHQMFARVSSGAGHGDCSALHDSARRETQTRTRGHGQPHNASRGPEGTRSLLVDGLWEARRGKATCRTQVSPVRKHVNQSPLRLTFPTWTGAPSVPHTLTGSRTGSRRGSHGPCQPSWVENDVSVCMGVKSSSAATRGV